MHLSLVSPRPMVLAVAALLALGLVGTLRVGLSTAQSPPAPTEPPATSAPDPTSAASATSVPAPRDDDDEEEPPPPATAVEELTVAPDATRTRRPTRTPATTPTPSATPVVAGALRLTLSTLPAAGVDGQPALRVTLANRDAVPAIDATLEIRLPERVEVGEPRTDMGQALPGAGLLHWYIPRLEPGAGAELTLPFAPGSAQGQDLTVCVLLLSAASPLEHCAALRLAAGTSVTAAVATATVELPEDSALASAEPVPAPAPPWGWALLLAGLGALGLWLGLRRRGASPKDSP